jgi:Flp pilus assembly protein TadD
LYSSKRLLGLASLAVFTSFAGCSIPDRLQTPFEPGLYDQILDRQRAGDAVDQDMVSELPDLTAEDYERLGDQHYARREPSRALLKYERGIELEPDREALRYKIGAIMLEKNLPGEAMVQFDKLSATNPENPLVELGRGRAWFALGDLAKSEESLRKCLEGSPDLWTAHETLGVLLDRSGRHAEAILEYRRALALRPTEISILNNLGVSLYLVRNYRESIETLETAAAIAPKNKLVHKNLARGYTALGRYTEALDAYSRAEGTPQAFNYLGEIFAASGNHAKAEVCFERAIEESPRYYEEASDNLLKTRRRTSKAGRAIVRISGYNPVSCP